MSNEIANYYLDTESRIKSLKTDLENSNSTLCIIGIGLEMLGELFTQVRDQNSQSSYLLGFKTTLKNFLESLPTIDHQREYMKFLITSLCCAGEMNHSYISRYTMLFGAYQSQTSDYLSINYIIDFIIRPFFFKKLEFITDFIKDLSEGVDIFLNHRDLPKTNLFYQLRNKFKIDSAEKLIEISKFILHAGEPKLIRKVGPNDCKWDIFLKTDDDVRPIFVREKVRGKTLVLSSPSISFYINALLTSYSIDSTVYSVISEINSTELLETMIPHSKRLVIDLEINWQVISDIVIHLNNNQKI